jgi:hypothetical protein
MHAGYPLTTEAGEHNHTFRLRSRGEINMGKQKAACLTPVLAFIRRLVYGFPPPIVLEVYCLLACGAVYSGTDLPIFLRKLIVTASVHNSSASKSDEAGFCNSNFGKSLPDCTVQHYKR